MSSYQAQVIKRSLNVEQLDLLKMFASGKAAALEFAAMLPPLFDPVPESLANIDTMNDDPVIINMASRNQILLSLVDYRSFAFDIDNCGMQVRLVGNFKGGGKWLLRNESKHHQAEMSSHGQPEVAGSAIRLLA